MPDVFCSVHKYSYFCYCLSRSDMLIYFIVLQHFATIVPQCVTHGNEQLITICSINRRYGPLRRQTSLAGAFFPMPKKQTKLKTKLI